MKRTITFTVGVVIFAAASAVGMSDHSNARNDAAVPGVSDFGQISVENLTAEQRAVLQSKYRYWTSAGSVTPKAPI